LRDGLFPLLQKEKQRSALEERLLGKEDTLKLSSRETARIFAALSDVTRVEIVRLVAKAPRNVSQLTSLVGVSQPKVSRHLRILRDTGLVRDVRRGKWVWYELAEPSKGQPGSMAIAALSGLFSAARSGGRRAAVGGGASPGFGVTAEVRAPLERMSSGAGLRLEAPGSQRPTGGARVRSGVRGTKPAASRSIKKAGRAAGKRDARSAVGVGAGKATPAKARRRASAPKQRATRSVPRPSRVARPKPSASSKKKQHAPRKELEDFLL
jgi:DNA-binding transcriptional ArsR family regulator